MGGVLRWILLLAVGQGLPAIAGCTFPDVDYADGGAGGASPTASSGSGDPCAEVSVCTATASTCDAMAEGIAGTCSQHCKNNPVCTMKCDQQLTAARDGCAMTCVTCAPGCSTAPAACRSAAGL